MVMVDVEPSLGGGFPWADSTMPTLQHKQGFIPVSLAIEEDLVLGWCLDTFTYPPRVGRPASFRPHYHTWGRDR